MFNDVPRPTIARYEITATHAGATIIATASGDDEAYLNSIGASRVIDYREAQFEKVLPALLESRQRSPDLSVDL